MISRNLSILVLLLLCSGAALADSIIIQSPTGATMDPAKDRFGFSADTGVVVEECRLVIDDNVSKTAEYHSVIKGRTISFAADYEDGEYTWRAECELANGTILASADSAIMIARPTSVVKTTPSGAFRGSMLHSFTIENDPDQQPIEISKIAAGDYIGITLSAYPSKSTKELYVKSRLAEEGVAKLWLTYKQEDYYVKEGENVTIPIGTGSSVILHFREVALNRVVLVAYPNLAARPVEETEPTEPTETPEPEETPSEETEPETPVVPAEPVETTPEPQERPGAFSRFLSWLVGLFGA